MSTPVVLREHLEYAAMALRFGAYPVATGHLRAALAEVNRLPANSDERRHYARHTWRALNYARRAESDMREMHRKESRRFAKDSSGRFHMLAKSIRRTLDV